MKKSVSLAIAAIAVMSIPALSTAANQTVRLSVPFAFTVAQQSGLGGFGQNVDFSTLVPRFDTSKGTLTKVTVRAFIRSSGTVTPEITLTGNSDQWDALLKLTANISVTPAGGTAFNAPVEGTWRNVKFNNYDGSLDYAGSSATQLNFSGSKMTINEYTAPSVLSAFSGAGSATVTFSPSMTKAVQWFETTPNNYFLPTSTSMTGTVGLAVIYSYTPF